jgi:hypothetical protein
VIAVVVTVTLIGGAFWGLYYALVNWPITLLWGALMVVLAFGALFGGLPTIISDVWFAWFVKKDEREWDEES